MQQKLAVEVRNLKKHYGSTVAVEDISFEVHREEIFGMVGPNGAGKTTTIECIEGLRYPDGGEIKVLDLDPAQDGYALRSQIGVQLQESALQDRIKVWEALDMFAAFYPDSANWQSLLDQLGLGEKRNTPFAKLSGGQKQRLFVALALVHNPKLIFLDELTTGLDPHARRAMWELVKDVRRRGKTIFLTTHFMEEAERLCDRVAIIDNGRIVALDSPANLIRKLKTDSRVILTIAGDFDEKNVRDLDGVTRIENSGDKVIVHGHGDQLVGDIVNALNANGVQFRDLRTEQPTLEDVFLSLTGRKMQNEEG